VSHRRYKRNTETRQGYPIRAKSEVKKQTEAVLVPS
jgi:predicted RNA binding protein YcfA (HicA-like mRNA interferase family)